VRSFCVRPVLDDSVLRYADDFFLQQPVTGQVKGVDLDLSLLAGADETNIAIEHHRFGLKVAWRMIPATVSSGHIRLPAPGRGASLMDIDPASIIGTPFQKAGIFSKQPIAPRLNHRSRFFKTQMKIAKLNKNNFSKTIFLK